MATASRYKLFVRTRSWQGDYRWVGRQPQQWWKGRAEAGLVINASGVWLSNSSMGNRIILTGITGTRRDFSGTPIRYELALEPDTQGSLTNDDVQALVAKYWNNNGSCDLGVEFDVAIGGTGNELIAANSAAIPAAIASYIKTLPRSVKAKPLAEMFPQSNKVITLAGSDLIYSELITPEIKNQFQVSPSKSEIVPVKTTGKAVAKTSGGGGCLIALGGMVALVALPNMFMWRAAECGR